MKATDPNDLREELQTITNPMGSAAVAEFEKSELGVTMDELKTDDSNVAPAAQYEVISAEIIAAGDSLAKGMLDKLKADPEVQKALTADGLTVDYKAIATAPKNWESYDVLKPASEVRFTQVIDGNSGDWEKVTEPGDTSWAATRALEMRIDALEARLALYNTKASHKI
jgi:hypothetical protein